MIEKQAHNHRKPYDLTVTANCDTKQYPADKYILSHAKELDHPFCFKDFCPPYSHGYIRNRLMKLKNNGEIEVLPHTCPRFYILKHWRPRFLATRNVTGNAIGVKVSRLGRETYEGRKVWTNFSAFLRTREVFGDATPQTRSSLFKSQREKVARKLNNQRLEKITFHTLRHWKATVEYHKTKDIIHVQQLLGHKSIQSTLIYISIEKALFKTEEDQWITKVAHDIQEGQKLVEVGFEFHCDFGAEGKLFRKRK